MKSACIIEIIYYLNSYSILDQHVEAFLAVWLVFFFFWKASAVGYCCIVCMVSCK